MSGSQLDPDLDRLGQALRASVTADLLREKAGTPPAELSRPPRRWSRWRPQMFAGGTLGLAGIGAALALALGSTAPPALAVTRQADGAVLIHLDVDARNVPDWVLKANRQLVAMGLDEQVTINLGESSAPAAGPVGCAPVTGSNAPHGPPVRVLLGSDGRIPLPAENTGDQFEVIAICTLSRQALLRFQNANGTEPRSGVSGAIGRVPPSAGQ